MHSLNVYLKSIALVFFGIFLNFEFAYATGLSKSVNIGPKAIGMGGAFVGVADDTTAVYHNPAGITQLDGTHIFIGADSLIGNVKFTPSGGNTEKSVSEFIPVPTFSLVSSIAKPVYFGLGVFFPHGNGSKYNSASSIPSHPTEGRIYSMEIIPTVAYKSDFGLSVGAGLRIVRIQNEVKGQAVDLDPSNPGTVLDNIEDLNVNGWSVGANVGLFYKPIKYISFGANLRSIIQQDLDGDIQTTNGGPINQATGNATNDVTLSQTLPLTLNAGFGFYPTDKLTIGLSYQYEQNESIKAFTIDINDGALSQTLPQNWESTHTIHVGADFKATEDLSVRAGYARDFNSAVPDEVINRVVGDLAANDVSLGAAYQLNDLNIGLTYNARFGERDVSAAGINPVDSNYKAFIHTISLGLGYKL